MKNGGFPLQKVRNYQRVPFVPWMGRSWVWGIPFRIYPINTHYIRCIWGWGVDYWGGPHPKGPHTIFPMIWVWFPTIQDLSRDVAPEKFRSKAKSVGGFVFGSGMPREAPVRCQAIQGPWYLKTWKNGWKKWWNWWFGWWKIGGCWKLGILIEGFCIFILEIIKDNFMTYGFWLMFVFFKFCHEMLSKKLTVEQ